MRSLIQLEARGSVCEGEMPRAVEDDGGMNGKEQGLGWRRGCLTDFTACWPCSIDAVLAI